MQQQPPQIDRVTYRKSDSVADLMTALAKAQADFGSPSKDSKNPYYGSMYADLASVLGAVRPALNKNGIVLMFSDGEDLDRQRASATTTLWLGDQFIETTLGAPAVGMGKDGKEKFDVQTLGSCWSYLRRYGVLALCAVAAEDDDGNALATQPQQQQQQRGQTTRYPANAQNGAPSPAPAPRRSPALSEALSRPTQPVAGQQEGR